ncbi:spoIIIJ-associated protein [Motilibacter peucedani]|uniref:SpoIIIJ-associated protein n=1 Tax=Motilibacter peucedani TaxID=598650 RepID=A0A420XU41_9ACTN|nr:R3H domain-containing nucleic acid-binding protein [Motilibacter peucedani]RKS80363.1 spoIIIJ-associated protein [Motilibacter peucedani]
MTDLPDTNLAADDVADAPDDAVTDEGAASAAPAGDDAPAAPSRRAALVQRLEEEGDVAADYLEGLLDIADLDGDIDMDVEADRAVVAIVGTGLDPLVGPSGKVLDALQELTRLAVQTQTGERTRLLLDVGGFRAARRTELTEVGRKAAERARGGERVELEPMSAFERKVVHDAVAAAGLTSESEGVEPARRVVVLPPSA